MIENGWVDSGRMLARIEWSMTGGMAYEMGCSEEQLVGGSEEEKG